MPKVITKPVTGDQLNRLQNLLDRGFKNKFYLADIAEFRCIGMENYEVIENDD
jgi:hypothetical protein